MKEIGLIPNESDNCDAAFCRSKMAEIGVDSMSLSRGLSQALAPFASLLREGKGLALIIHGDDASVVGLDVSD